MRKKNNEYYIFCVIKKKKNSDKRFREKMKTIEKKWMNQKANQENEEQKTEKWKNENKQRDTTAINECLKKGRKKSCRAVKHFTDERRFLHYSLKVFFFLSQHREVRMNKKCLNNGYNIIYIELEWTATNN